MKNTPKNKEILKLLGFKEERDFPGSYVNKSGWGFSIEYMPNFKTLLDRLLKSSYNDGYTDCKNGKRGRFKLEDGR